MSEADELTQMLHVTYELYLRHEQFVDALRVALRMESTDRIVKTFNTCKLQIDAKADGTRRWYSPSFRYFVPG